MFKLHKDAGWIVSHAWSFRFLVLAAVLSGAEAALPLLVDHAPLPHRLFALIMGVIVAAALVARLIVQEHPPELFPEAEHAPAVGPAPMTPEQIKAFSHAAAVAAMNAHNAPLPANLMALANSTPQAVQ